MALTRIPKATWLTFLKSHFPSSKILFRNYNSIWLISHSSTLCQPIIEWKIELKRKAPDTKIGTFLSLIPNSRKNIEPNSRKYKNFILPITLNFVKKVYFQTQKWVWLSNAPRSENKRSVDSWPSENTIWYFNKNTDSQTTTFHVVKVILTFTRLPRDTFFWKFRGR